MVNPMIHYSQPHMGQVYTDNTLTTTLDEHLTNLYAPITDLDMLEDKKADKTALAVTKSKHCQFTK